MTLRQFMTAAAISLFFYTGMAQAWQEQTTVDNNDVRVWTKKVENSEFKAFRGEVTIAAPIQQVFDFISDTPKAKEWYFNTLEAKRIKQTGDKQFLIYSVTNAPWPVSDRDSVTQVTVDDAKQDEITITLQAKPDALPLKENKVRITELNGFWKLQKINDNTTRVIFEMAAQPGGLLPSCLANSMAVDMPYKSLTNLKAKLESHHTTAANF